MVVSMPSAGAGQVGPTFRSTKLPVPYVFLAIPGVKHAWPIRAACWSPATPEIGMPPGHPASSDVSPNRPLDGKTVGRADIGTPNRPHMSADHNSVRMSKSIVRLAFVGSVACPAAREVPDQPRVDRAERELIVDAGCRDWPTAIRTSMLRSTGPARAPSSGEPAADDRRCATPRSGQRYAGPATRWPSRTACRCADSRQRPSRVGWRSRSRQPIPCPPCR